jgi:hypothetical protein
VRLTAVCRYSVEGGAASRLGQCAHAFVRTLFSKGCAARWMQPQVRLSRLGVMLRHFRFDDARWLQPELLAEFLALRKTHMATDEDVAGGGRRKRRRGVA